MDGQDAEIPRLIAWGTQMRATHQRLREALAVARGDIEHGSSPATSDLRVYCRGFCTALSRHHTSEDDALFPELRHRHPELGEVLDKLSQDHSMISYLISGLDDAVARAADQQELERHLEGIAAIMESHFRYEERELLRVLDTLELDADPAAMLGPL